MEGRVSPDPIVEAFDEFKGNASRLRSCLEIFAIKAFSLETMKKAFHDRIIITISSAAHARFDTFVLQKRLIALTRVRTSTIRVMK